MVYMVTHWTPSWSNAVFSTDERDRRWAKVRSLMARDGFDVLVCLPWNGNHDRSQADPRYLTQLGENTDETTVVFPIEGPVVAWHSRGGAWPSSNWLHDGVRAAPRGTGGRTVVAYLNEIGFERGSIGIAGLTGGILSHCRLAEGEVNWQSVQIIKQAFPNATVTSATDLLGEARYVKSEEEIAFLTEGTKIAEEVSKAIAEHARAGVREREVWARMMYTYADLGGSFEPMFGWISGPLGHTHTRIEQPTMRTFENGDVLVVEIDGRWGGYIAQIDETYSIGHAPKDLIDGMALAHEAFNRVCEAMSPGVTVAELWEIAGNVQGLSGRGAARLGMHGRGTGDDGPLIIPRPPSDDVAGVTLLEDTVMCVKPGAVVDGNLYGGNWGDSVRVTPRGGQRLGTRPQRLFEQV